MAFDYFYGNESMQFAFYRIPKTLMLDPQFDHVSLDAKLLYGLLLDRTAMSMENSWFDEQGRAYIFYSIEEIAREMHCGKTKAVALLSELDTEKGIGLVEKVRTGQGNPNRIYVRKFSSEFQNLKFKNFRNRTSSISESETPEVQKVKSNNTYRNKTERIRKENIKRNSFGSYSNVLLSDDEMKKLKEEFPADYSQRIELLSGYIASTGKKYKDHLATIRNWARREQIKPKPTASANYDLPEGEYV